MTTRCSHSIVHYLALGLLVSAAVGCATGSSELRHGTPAGIWTARLPVNPSPIAALAFGTPGAGEAAPLLPPDPAPLPAAAPPQHPLLVAKLHRRASKRPAHAVAQPAAAQPEPSTPPKAAETPAVNVREPVQLASAEQAEQRYASREASAQEQQKFRGGDAIVISAGALVIVLLIVILVLLLR